MIFKLIILLLLSAASIVDIYSRQIPPSLTALICIAGILARYHVLPTALIDGLLSGLLLYVPTLFIKEAFGGGDIKLTAALGVGFGFQPTLNYIILTLALSGIFSMLYFTILKKKVASLPMAPFLFLSFTLTLLFS